MWSKNFRNPFAIMGILIGFIGVAMLYIEQYMSQGIHEFSERGMLILIFGCISWALGTLYTKYFTSGEESTYSFAGSAWQMIFASLMFWIFALVRKEPASVSIQSISAYSWFSISYLIVFGSLLAYSAYIWLLKERPATEVGTHAYVNPVIAILFGALLGKEQVTWIQFAGLAVILISVSLIQLKLKPAISE
jgi:drug/metabolite transporter (DMT)-like permease